MDMRPEWEKLIPDCAVIQIEDEEQKTKVTVGELKGKLVSEDTMEVTLMKLVIGFLSG